jgi:hypothetical protein
MCSCVDFYPETKLKGIGDNPISIGLEIVKLGTNKGNFQLFLPEVRFWIPECPNPDFKSENILDFLLLIAEISQ